MQCQFNLCYFMRISPLAAGLLPRRGSEELKEWPTPQEKARVEQANASYSGMARLIIFLIKLNVSISVENPLNSLFWLTSAMMEAFRVLGAGHYTVLQHCMHGENRDKSTKLWSYNPRSPNENLLVSLGLMCDKQHTHKSWKPYRLNGKLCFPTKEEAAYPFLLCHRLASIFVREATARSLAARCDMEHNCSMTAALENETSSPPKPGATSFFLWYTHMVKKSRSWYHCCEIWWMTS